TSGYVKKNILNYGVGINTALSAGVTFYFFSADNYMSTLYYSPVALSGAGYKHQPSGTLAAGGSAFPYRNPVFPQKNEKIGFYFTDSAKSLSLSPVLYWKQKSSSSWMTAPFSYSLSESDYSVYYATLTLNYSTGTVVDYFIAAGGYYIFRSGEDNLSNNSNYTFGVSSAAAAAKPFTFMVAGLGNCFHYPETSFGNTASMRVPLNPLSGDEIDFYVGNQASGSGNYGNMNGGQFHYYENGVWKTSPISWSEDIGEYKYWKTSLTPSTTIAYYFSVTYDDHNTTYFYGDGSVSAPSGSENEARAFPFTLNFSTVAFNISLTPAAAAPVNLLIYEAGTFIKAYESAVSSFASVSLYNGNFELIIKGGNYQTIYSTVSFPSPSKTYSLLYSSTPHSFMPDGNCGGNFCANELIGVDSQSDSAWGAKNDLYNLWATFDTDNLYLGLKGVLENNSVVLYLDCGDYLGSIDDASALPWGQGRNHKFPDGFRPDFQFTFWDFTGGAFYRITSSTTLDDVTSQVSQAVKGGGSGETGSLEIKIPFSVIYNGITAFGIPAGAKLGIAAAVCGGDGTSAKDIIPDQSAYCGDTFDEFSFDTWFEIPLDADLDNAPDEGRYIADIAYSTSSAAASQTAVSSGEISYGNFNATEYFYKERDMPLSVYSVNADSAVLKWKNTAESAYATLYPALNASTFIFTVSADYVFGSIDYYFVLYKGTESLNTEVYSIDVMPEIVLTPGSREYSAGNSKIIFEEPLGESAKLFYLEPESLITDGILPLNPEINISTDGMRLPAELYEIEGNIPPASLTLSYFDDADEDKYAVYFYDGSNWIYKISSRNTSANTITFSINQQGKIGIFKITSASFVSGTNISSVSKPVFNPGLGEKIEFNFIQSPAVIKIEIFDMNGRKIKELSGESSWGGRDRNNNTVPAGAYLYHLETDSDDFWGTLGVWK
ncbi:MAG: hypothetical protein U9O97_01320, partial [Elusimicrobiota bacterium]|nr:hypothetical protein [Elusimicrobiota bacterium]